jgi:hypothetical protein
MKRSLREAHHEGTRINKRGFDPDVHLLRPVTGVLIFLILGLSLLVTGVYPLEEKPGKEAVKELVLTPDQMKKYAASYKNPYVLHIRKVINNYLRGKLVGDDNYKALAAVDQEYLKNKFIVLSIEDSLMGGREISLMSQMNPDKIFWAWVYRTGSLYELRAFEVQEHTEEEIKNISVRFRRFLRDKTLAL